MGYTKENYINIFDYYHMKSLPNTTDRAKVLGVMEAILVQNDFLVAGKDFNYLVIDKRVIKETWFRKKRVEIIKESYDDLIIRHYKEFLKTI